MKTRRNWKKWVQVTMLLALASLATTGFTFVGHDNRAAATTAQPTPCELAWVTNLGDDVCFGIESAGQVLEAMERALNAARSSPSPGDTVDPASVIEAARRAVEQLAEELNAARSSTSSSDIDDSMFQAESTSQILDVMERELNAVLSSPSPSYELDPVFLIESAREAVEQLDEELNAARTGP